MTEYKASASKLRQTATGQLKATSERRRVTIDLTKGRADDDSKQKKDQQQLPARGWQTWQTLQGARVMTLDECAARLAAVNNLHSIPILHAHLSAPHLPQKAKKLKPQVEHKRARQTKANLKEDEYVAVEKRTKYTVMPTFFRSTHETTPYTILERKAAISMLLNSNDSPHKSLCLDPSTHPLTKINVMKSFRLLSLLVHPDKAVGLQDSGEAFVILQRAREKLMNIAS